MLGYLDTILYFALGGVENVLKQNAKNNNTIQIHTDNDHKKSQTLSRYKSKTPRKRYK